MKFKLVLVIKKGVNNRQTYKGWPTTYMHDISERTFLLQIAWWLREGAKLEGTGEECWISWPREGHPIAKWNISWQLGGFRTIHEPNWESPLHFSGTGSEEAWPFIEHSAPLILLIYNKKDCRKIGRSPDEHISLDSFCKSGTMNRDRTV